MKKVDGWTAAYEDFLACSERFTEELDRFQDGIREGKSVLARSEQFVSNVDAASKKIAHQVTSAERAWANADRMALDAATKAHEAAFQGVQSSFNSVTQALAKSVRANQDAALLVKKGFSQSRKVVFYLGFSFILISGLAIFTAVYLAYQRESLLELDIRQNAARFELIWSKATPKEKENLRKILSRALSEP